MTHALVFQNTTFDVIDQNGQPWLRMPQIGVALGYANSYHVQKIYSANADEFTDSMTAVVKLPTAGGEQETRIFSLRGCHLLAMLSRTQTAKAFRRWVLDILDRETGSAPGQPTPAAIERPIISAALHALIDRKAYAVALQQYDAIKDIITVAVQENLDCGATADAAAGYVETYGDIASDVTIINSRDIFLLAHQTTGLLNTAGEALATIHSLEKHLGRNLYPRKQHGEFGIYGLPACLVEQVLSAAIQSH